MNSLYITKSKIRKGLLRLFFSNIHQKYYLREIERLLGYSAGNIRRELLTFKKDGLFTTEKSGNLLYYSLNTHHPLFNDLKNLLSKTIGIEGTLSGVLSNIKGIKTAFIYGSYAKSEDAIGSDIDLLIIGRIDQDILLAHINKLQKALNREINYSVYSEKDWEKKKKEKDSFIVDLLENPKMFLMGDVHDL
ncbi:MAG: nucleotidyltransferase domain-containing protein [Candidatus Omnitrophica bacterium]|nr:nucleotidyltransferase domain-containing protein [Candidatus Omnitrophota bacterium]